ncbi:hypothetical protein ACIQWA_10685 [Kitasatospora sp. NPDC098652]|uniref:hypothetical protein n=1 Tax=Kitasatospora sp. NPDC098652 TaxID=3364095 RepID=UPI00381ED13C
MQVAVVTFDGFNELDSFIASALINRCRRDGLEAFVTTPTPTVTSMNGVEVTGQRPLGFVAEADAVLIGSGVRTRDVVADDRLLRMLPLDPARQLVGSQCSGALVLARLGLLGTMPACTDTTSRPFVEAAGVTVLRRVLWIRPGPRRQGTHLAALSSVADAPHGLPPPPCDARTLTPRSGPT